LISIRFFIFFLTLLLSIKVEFVFAESKKGQNPRVDIIKISGPINPIASNFIIKNIESAKTSKSEALIIEMDTPGGLMEAMRDIVKSVLSSEIPIIVFISPSGSRAASAGVFITMAAHVAAMAPSTNIGAAHPVKMGTDTKKDDPMMEKILNDTIAYIKGIAKKRNRNVSWAEKAVRHSVSITESEALKTNVIDLIAEDINELIKKVHGKNIQLSKTKKVQLNTQYAERVTVEMSVLQQFLYAITNPNVAYILLLLGIYGLFFELSNPGGVFPGVLGGICLILALFALNTLPINYAGMLLIVLSIILFVAEAFVRGFGVLGLGGAVALVFGSILLIDSPNEIMQISTSVIMAGVGTTTVFFFVIIYLVIKTHKSKPVTGKESMIGEIGIVKNELNYEGSILIRGEIWKAYSDQIIKADEKVVVTGFEGLKMKVEKKGE
jgi:membrane-bound serine protease (ClpP class)